MSKTVWFWLLMMTDIEKLYTHFLYYNMWYSQCHIYVYIICIYLYIYLYMWSESRSVMSDSLWPNDLTVHGILQALLKADSLPAEPPGKPSKTGVGSLSILQGIFLTQESNWGLLHCRWILYQLSYKGIFITYLHI